MPATSKAQQRVMAIAAHAPGTLYARNRRLASLPKATLREFAETARRGLPARAKKRGLAHGDRG